MEGLDPTVPTHNDNVASPCSMCLHVQGGLGGTTKECTPPATIKKRAMHACDLQSGGVLAPHAWASVAGRRMVDHQDAGWSGGSRDALEGKGPRRRPQKERRLEGVAKAVGGG